MLLNMSTCFLQHEEYLYSLLEKVQYCGLMNGEDLTQEMAKAANTKVLETMGSCSDAIPCVKRVDISLRNVPPKEVSHHTACCLRLIPEHERSLQKLI